MFQEMTLLMHYLRIILSHGLFGANAPSAILEIMNF